MFIKRHFWCIICGLVLGLILRTWFLLHCLAVIKNLQPARRVRRTIWQQDLISLTAAVKSMFVCDLKTTDLWFVCRRTSRPAAAASERPAARPSARGTDPSHPGRSDPAAEPVSAGSALKDTAASGLYWIFTLEYMRIYTSSRQKLKNGLEDTGFMFDIK